MFTKKINPTFKATVQIPVPGQDADPVEFTFKAKTTEAFDALLLEISEGKKTLADACREVVDGWTHPAVEFSPEKLTECFSLLPGSPLAIMTTFRRSLFEGRQKN